MTITAEESTQQIYDALIKVFKDAKVPKSNDVIPKVAALMKLMLAFIDGDGDLQLHPRSNMPGKVLRLMAEVAQAMPGVLVDFTAATGNGHRSVWGPRPIHQKEATRRHVADPSQQQEGEGDLLSASRSRHISKIFS